MKVSLIAAVARNGVIGGAGALPWRIRDDLKWFKEHTMGKSLLMGRKTFDSIGKALPGRDNIIVTRQPEFAAPRTFIVRSLSGGLALARVLATARGANEICVIGGGDIYAQTIARAERLYITRVDAAPEGDAFFPPIRQDEWRARAVGGCEKSPGNEYACEFFILDRISARH